MPGGDRTGPMGMGPMSGRRTGYCAGYSGPGFMFSGPGLGFGRGMGYGSGFGRGLGYGRGRGGRRADFGPFWGYPNLPIDPYPSYQPITEEQEVAFLEDQLGQIQKRLEELKKQKKE